MRLRARPLPAGSLARAPTGTCCSGRSFPPRSRASAGFPAAAGRALSRRRADRCSAASLWQLRRRERSARLQSAPPGGSRPPEVPARARTGRALMGLVAAHLFAGSERGGAAWVPRGGGRRTQPGPAGEPSTAPRSAPQSAGREAGAQASCPGSAVRASLWVAARGSAPRPGNKPRELLIGAAAWGSVKAPIPPPPCPPPGKK